MRDALRTRFRPIGIKSTNRQDPITLNFRKQHPAASDWRQSIISIHQCFGPDCLPSTSIDLFKIALVNEIHRIFGFPSNHVGSHPVLHSCPHNFPRCFVPCDQVCIGTIGVSVSNCAYAINSTKSITNDKGNIPTVINGDWPTT